MTKYFKTREELLAVMEVRKRELYEERYAECHKRYGWTRAQFDNNMVAYARIDAAFRTVSERRRAKEQAERASKFIY